MDVVRCNVLPVRAVHECLCKIKSVISGIGNDFKSGYELKLGLYNTLIK